jgi:hypothetical protein
MADPVHPTETGVPHGHVAPLVTGIIDDLQELIKQNLALFKVEVREDFKKTRDAVSALGVGVGLAAVGGLHLTLMLVFLLQWAAPAIPLWGCFGIVGGSMAAVGAALYLRGKRKLESFNPLPDESAKALEETVQWIKNKI